MSENKPSRQSRTSGPFTGDKGGSDRPPRRPGGNPEQRSPNTGSTNGGVRKGKR